MDSYQKEMTDKMVNAANQINDRKEAYERAEEDKQALMVGNEEKTEKRLNKTNEHGQILMTINSIFNTLMKERDASKESIVFAAPSLKNEQPSHFNDIQTNEKFAVKHQLKTIKDFIDHFGTFWKNLKKPIDNTFMQGNEPTVVVYDEIR